MDEQLIIKKIQALLHDPPEKAIILGRIGHEGRAKETLGRLIDDTSIPDDVKNADHIASAADRINLPKDENFVSDFLKEPVIVHPLSGKQFDLKSLAQIDLTKITGAVDNTISHLVDKYQENTEVLYLSLWRELVEHLKVEAGGESRLGQLWELLPADTRIPDHSIWEHKRVTSAIAGALPKPAFLLFTIGPVQDFIATARKTQDLWSGSYLLSYLAWCAMKVVADVFGPDSIIFPDLCRQPMADLWLLEKGLNVEIPQREELSSPTLPNRFLAIIPENKAAEVGDQAKQIVYETFQEICKSVQQEIEKRVNIDNQAWSSIWNRQTKDFMEVYWASIAVEKPNQFLEQYENLFNLPSDWGFASLFEEYKKKGFGPNIGTIYGQMYRLADKVLGSRKMVRNFRQSEEPNHKCTLCGVREPVHPGMYNGQNCAEHFSAMRAFWQEEMLKAFPDIRNSERLCGVCITKRLSPKFYFKDHMKFEINNIFPSVSMVATAAFKLRIIDNMDNPGLFVAVANYVQAVKNIAGERWNGIALPMVRRACRNPESFDFASLEGDWLYKEAFDNKKAYQEECGKKLSPEEFDQFFENAKHAQRKFYDAIKTFERETGKYIGTPSTYYAVILMDGDNMGKWLSGENASMMQNIMHPSVRNALDESWKTLRMMERPLNPSLHLSTSKALRDFSLSVTREIVEKDHLGKLVYAGGDDVLAFVSLANLSDVMRKLRAYFSGSLSIDTEKNRVEIDFKNGAGFVPTDEKEIPINVGSRKPVKGFLLSMGTTATASMGVVIAHHSSNLSQILEEVRQCEKDAKKVEGKNAFCIALAKRAGGTEHLLSKWYYGDNCFESIPLLQDWATAFANDYVSPKLVYGFKTETRGLEGLPDEAIYAELLRIAERQRNKKVEKFRKDDLVRLVGGLTSVLTGNRQNLKDFGINDIAVFLSIAAFLGREANR